MASTMISTAPSRSRPTIWRSSRSACIRSSTATSRSGAGMIFFHQEGEAAGRVFCPPKGWPLHRLRERYRGPRLERADYVEVKTPQLLDRALWERTGHWDNFRENMFTAESKDERIL